MATFATPYNGNIVNDKKTTLKASKAVPNQAVDLQDIWNAACNGKPLVVDERDDGLYHGEDFDTPLLETEDDIFARTEVINSKYADAYAAALQKRQEAAKKLQEEKQEFENFKQQRDEFIKYQQQQQQQQPKSDGE